jgi:DNA-binding ferritin-like protein
MAQQLDAANTVDLFTEISRGIEKWLWIVVAPYQASNQ